jgi:ferrous iron transport protein B
VAGKEPIVVALAGNPNSGKTSLYNFITGSRQHVGNYPGVTVERKEGTVPVDDVDITYVDLPGTYSLSPYSIEEHVARHEILSPRISGIIIVVDTTRLERNLYLVSQIIETGKPVMLALNMYDEFEDSGSRLDVDQLSNILGIPCVRTVGNRGKGVMELMAVSLKAVRDEIPAFGKPPHYSHEMEHAIDKATEFIKDKSPHNERWTAVNLLVYGKKYADENDFGEELYENISRIRQRLEELEGRSIQSIVTSGRYGFASGAVAECMKEKVHIPRTTSDKIDAVLTHKWFGLPIFLVILWMMFQTTFTLGEMPMEFISLFFRWLGKTASAIIPGGFISSLVVDGIIAGVGGVLVFIPIILILFFFISLLEDTGYMARAAFIMDRIMHFLGLHGKSFLPMLVGFGCTVPAIMATRMLESRRERLITMFILPFMSCGARLPVYVLLAGAFFGSQYSGSIIFSLYLAGVLLSFIVAKLLSFTPGTPAPFVMELPPYRIPTPRSVLLHIWERAYLYVRKAGTIILAASIIMWFLVSFPGQKESVNPSQYSGRTDGAVQLEYTYAGRLGKVIEPVLKPLGFDWRIGVALLTGFAAKEVIVSSLGTIYSVGGKNEKTDNDGLKRAIRSDPNLNPVKAYGLMLFILIYVPCIAVLSILKREAGGWKWVGIMVVYTTSLAWLVSFSFIKIAGFFL